MSGQVVIPGRPRLGRLETPRVLVGRGAVSLVAVTLAAHIIEGPRRLMKRLGALQEIQATLEGLRVFEQLPADSEVGQRDQCDISRLANLLLLVGCQMGALQSGSP